MSVREVLVNSGCTQSTGDPSFFYMKISGKLAGVIVSHIDDFLHAGTDDFEEQAITPLVQSFSAGRAEEKEFSYVGFQITQTEEGIVMDQDPYISSLEAPQWSVEALKDKKRDLSRSEQTDYRALIGSLNWCVRGTRPELAFEMIELSMKLKVAKVEDWLKALKVWKRLKNTDSAILFPDMGDFKSLELIVYSDASFANLDGVGSAMAYMIFGRNVRTNNTSPLTWKANKVKRIVKSTLAAEGLSLSAALDDAFYLRRFLEETLEVVPPIMAYVDNRGLVENVHSTKLVDDTRLNIDLGAIKQMLLKEEVTGIQWCSNTEQVVDVMTKRGASGEKLRQIMRSGYVN